MSTELHGVTPQKKAIFISKILKCAAIIYVNWLVPQVITADARKSEVSTQCLVCIKIHGTTSQKSHLVCASSVTWY